MTKIFITGSVKRFSRTVLMKIVGMNVRTEYTFSFLANLQEFMTVKGGEDKNETG